MQILFELSVEKHVDKEICYLRSCERKKIKENHLSKSWQFFLLVWKKILVERL